MIIAIPSSSDKPDAIIDERFGRCSFFCFYHTDTKNLEFKENTLKNAAEGVGPQVVAFLANNGVSEVYAREFGPKAKNMLEKLSIKMKLVEEKQTLEKLIERINRM
jgi:predicted Fe-Mo cluster-binding NifX family protein